MTSGKGSKLLRYVEHRIRVTLQDSRTIIGTFLAFDKHLNLVLVDTEEFRTLRNKRGSSEARAAMVEERQEKRSLGLIILRGETVVSIAVEGPPPPEKRARTMGPGGIGGPGGAGRGQSVGASGGVGRNLPPPGVPMGLGAAPVHGVGGMGVGGPSPGMGRGMPPPRY